MKKYTGKSVLRVDAYDKATGRAKYVDDLCPKDALIMKICHSTIGHGYVKSIDTAEAEAVPGVIKILTCFDVPDIQFPTPGHPWSTDPHHQDPADRKLLNRHVRYYGDDVAVVIAENEIAANQAVRHPAYLCQAVILGLAAYYACMLVTDRVIGLLVPGFSNYNDSAIATMGQDSRLLVIIGTVLVPTVEECVFRGLIFRNLYGKSHWCAYIVSMLAFALIHILGYVRQYTPLEILMAVLQYLPAGLCLAWSYTKADTIFAPIAIHATVNFITLTSWR